MAKRKLLKTRKPYKKKPTASKMNMKQLMKKVVFKTCETKRLVTPFTKVEMFHNVFSLSQCLTLNGNMPSQGSGEHARIGDRINTIAFNVKLLIGQKSDRPNVNFRWFCIQVPKGGALPYNSVFNNITNNILLDDLNKDYVKILKQGYWRPNQAALAATGNDEYTFVKKVSIPYRRLVRFGPTDGVTSHNQNDVYFCIMCYDAFGALITDNIAYYQAASEMIYKDP